MITCRIMRAASIKVLVRAGFSTTILAMQVLAKDLNTGGDSAKNPRIPFQFCQVPSKSLDISEHPGYNISTCECFEFVYNSKSEQASTVATEEKQ